jgi:DNA repair protein RadC
MKEDRFATLELRFHKIERLPSGSRSIAKLCQTWGLGAQPQEAMWVISYDLNGNIRTVLEVARGGHSDMEIHIPSVLTAVLCSGSIAFTLAHNHPALSVAPSVSDQNLSLSIMEAANACSLIYEEHLIVCPTDEYFSFVEAGLLRAAPRGGGKELNLKSHISAIGPRDR